MRRRDILVLLGGAAVFPLLARAQQPAKPYRIGILSLLKRLSEDVFRDAMRDLGYVEGENLVYETRYAEGHADRLAALAADLVRLKVDVIVTAGSPAAEAAKQTTAAVPIVLWGAGDPIGIGLVTNVTHPGGNITGVTELSTELTAKRLQLFKEAVPGLKRMAVIWNAGDQAMSLRFREVEAAAPGLSLGVMPLPIQALDDFDASFEVMARDRPDDIFVVSAPVARRSSRSCERSHPFGARVSASVSCRPARRLATSVLGGRSDKRVCLLPNDLLTGACPATRPSRKFLAVYPTNETTIRKPESFSNIPRSPRSSAPARDRLSRA